MLLDFFLTKMSIFECTRALFFSTKKISWLFYMKDAPIGDFYMKDEPIGDNGKFVINISLYMWYGQATGALL